MDHYPRHISDWRTATYNLNRMKRSIYSDLIDHYYDKEGPIRLTFDLLCEEMGCVTVEERDALEYILGRYFRLDNGAYFHDRCEEEIARYRQKALQSAGAANSRWSKRSERKAAAGDAARSGASGVDASALRPQCENDASGMPTINHKPITIPPSAGAAGGEGFDFANPPPQKHKPSRKCPKNFKITAEMLAWAGEKTPLLGREDIDRETATFRDHTFGNAISDWNGAWRNWLRKEQKFREQRLPPRVSPRDQKQAAQASYIDQIKGKGNGNGVGEQGAIDVESRVVRDDEALPPDEGAG